MADAFDIVSGTLLIVAALALALDYRSCVSRLREGALRGWGRFGLGYQQARTFRFSYRILGPVVTFAAGVELILRAAHRLGR